MGVIDRICGALDRMGADGREPARLLLGHREAAELEAALYRKPLTILGLMGEAVYGDEGFAPKFPLDMEPARFLGVPIERVDQDELLGVIAENEAIGIITRSGAGV